MAKKHKRRLGHITSNEKQDIRTSVDDALDQCVRRFGRSAKGAACELGISFVEHGLNNKGYSLAGKRRR